MEEIVILSNSKTKIGTINIMNSCAERGLRLSADFKEAVKTEQHFENDL